MKNLNLTGNLVTTNLTVNGTQTILNSNEVDISDLAIKVASNLENVGHLSNENAAGIDVSNVASIKFNGMQWNIQSDTGEVLINNQKEVATKDLDLTGKIKSITCANADAIGYIYREDEQTMISFNSMDDVTAGSRCDHLKGQTMPLEWSNIFID